MVWEVWLGPQKPRPTHFLKFPPTDHSGQDWLFYCDLILPLKPQMIKIYSDDYGIEYEYDSLFGAVMGVSGTVTYSKYCFRS